MTREEAMEVFRSLEKKVKQCISGFEIRLKSESWSSKLVAILVWIFNRHYLTDYTTTRYPKVYFPSRAFLESNPLLCTKILAHEFVHLWDRRKLGFWSDVGYMLPQAVFLLWLPVIVLTAIFEPWWVALLCSLPGVLCLLPLPAYWRMRAEMRGYAMTIAVNLWRYGSVSESTLQWVAQEFTGSTYYFMWPMRREVRRRLALACIRLRENPGTLVNWQACYDENWLPFVEVYRVLRCHGLIP